jgi:hypothetical protein
MADYVSLTELKNSQELMGVSFADYDAMKAIPAASRAVENITGRVFTTSVGTRYYSPSNASSLNIDDYLGGGTVASDNDADGTFETEWTLNTDYVLEPLNAAAGGWPYEQITVHPRGTRRFPCWPRSVSVAGTFGWTTVPEGVYAATVIIAAQTVKFMREAPFGVVGLGIDNIAVRVSRSNPQIAMHLEPYVKGGQGVMVA